MDKDIVIQTLLESFGTIKDLWDTKSDAISNAIDAMSQYDMGLAAEMWAYELEKNKEKLSKVEESEKLVLDIFNKIGERHGYYTYPRGESDYMKYCENEGTYILNNKTLCCLLYGESYNLSMKYPKENYEHMSMVDNPLPWLFAYILITKEENFVKEITKSMVTNKNCKDVNSTELLRRVLYLLNTSIKTKSNKRYNIKDSTKFALLEATDRISNPIDKSELTIAILSLK